jgi:hypothetical protein
MNKEELTDVLFSIKSIIKDSDEGYRTQIRHIDELVDWALAQNDFPVLEQELVDFLEEFGNKEFNNTCTGMLSGEFCYAEYDYSDEEDIVFKLKYGINDGNENTLYTDDFRISVYDFENCKTFQEKYEAVQEA